MVKHSLTKKLTVALLGLITVACFAIFGALNFGGKNVARAESVDPDEFSIYNGAQVRLVEPNGLRFFGLIGSTKYASIVEGGEIKSGIKLGTFIVPKSYYDDYAQYKLDNPSYTGTSYEYFKNIKGKIIDYYWDADQIQDVSSCLSGLTDGYCVKTVVSDIYFDNLNLDFVCAMFTYDTDLKTYDISSDVVTSRTIAYTASAALNNGETSAFLSDVVKKAALNAQGVTYDDTKGVYVYLGSEYDTIDDLPIKADDAFSIDITEKSLTHSGTFTITPNANFKKLALKYTSSDETVATVNNNGVVTANATNVGVVKITVQGGGYSRECIVTVGHENETALTYGVKKVENCSCGLTGYVGTKLNADGTFYNNDFEADFVNWNKYYGDASKMNIKTKDTSSITTTPMKDNATGKFFEIAVQSSANRQLASNAFSVTAGDTITADFTFYRNGTYSKGYSSFQFWKIEDGVLVKVGTETTRKYLTSGANWYKASATNCVPSAVVPEGATFATLILGDDGSSQACFDNVSIKMYGINKATAELVHSGTVQLSTTKGFTSSVVWSSSDSTIATVDNTGLVTADATNVGKVTITATEGSISASCVVTVGHDYQVLQTLTYGVKKVSCSCGLNDYVGLALNADGSFENSDIESGLTNWNKYYGSASYMDVRTKDTTSVTAAGIQTGSTGSFLEILKQTSANRQFASNLVKVTAGDTITADFSYYRNGTYSKGYSSFQFWKVENDALVKVGSETTRTYIAYGGAWYKASASNCVPSTIVPEDATFAMLILGDDGSAEACFDNVKFSFYSLNKSSATLSHSGTVQLNTDKGFAGSSVTWSSSDTTIATVSSTGLVTADASNTGYVTITATEGNAKATCVILVDHEYEVSKTLNYGVKKVSCTCGLDDYVGLALNVDGSFENSDFEDDFTNWTKYYGSATLMDIKTKDTSSITTDAMKNNATGKFFEIAQQSSANRKLACNLVKVTAGDTISADYNYYRNGTYSKGYGCFQFWKIEDGALVKVGSETEYKYVAWGGGWYKASASNCVPTAVVPEGATFAMLILGDDQNAAACFDNVKITITPATT